MPAEPPCTTDNNTSPQPTSLLSNSWFVMMWLAADYFVLYSHRRIVNFVLPPLQSELTVTDAQVGDLQMAFLVSYGLTQFFVGYLSDRFQRRLVLLFSLVGSVLSLMGMGLANGFIGLLALQILLGMSQSASVPAMAGMMADCFSPKIRSTAVAVYLVSQNVAILAAGWLGGEIAEQEVWTLPGWLGQEASPIAGWRMAMFIFALLGFAVMIGMLLLLREPKRTGRSEDKGLGVQGGSFWRTTWSVLSNRTYLLLAVVYLLINIINYPMSVFLAKYLHIDFGMELGQAGFYATFFIQIFTVLGLFVGGPWADDWAKRMKAGRVWVQLFGMLMVAPALFWIGTSHQNIVLILAMSVHGLGWGLYTTNLWTSVFDVVDPAARSTAIALLNVAALFVSPTSRLIGSLVDEGRIGYGDAFAATSLVAIATVFILAITAVYFLPRDYRGPLNQTEDESN
ncbi:MAG: MFS transporter [Pirellulaceae bacterium]|nr:MFS transporter [Pirellulaceae bacterium]